MKVGTQVKVIQPVVLGTVIRCASNEGTGELEALVMVDEGGATVHQWLPLSRLEVVPQQTEGASEA